MPRPSKPVDIYVERANTSGVCSTLELCEDGLYRPGTMRLVSDLSMMLPAPRINKAAAIRVRQIKIEELEAMGKKVKGVNNIIALRKELFEGQFEMGEVISTIDDVMKFVRDSDMNTVVYWYGRLMTKKQFGSIGIGRLYEGVEAGEVNRAVRKAG